jgi:hypothetical protein
MQPAPALSGSRRLTKSAISRDFVVLGGASAPAVAFSRGLASQVAGVRLTSLRRLCICANIL